jgi:hypothetical protein
MKMIKAGALYYAIFISFIVALLGGFFIMNVWMHHASTLNILTAERLERNVNSGILLAQEYPLLVSVNGKEDIDLFDDGNDNVSLTKTQWGGYCLMQAVAKSRLQQKSIIVLLGKDIFVNEKYALYLADKEQALSISGNTIIKGDCYLPKLGLRKAYIEGTSFRGKDLIVGKINNSASQLPSINDFMVKSTQDYLNQNFSSSDSLVDISILLKSNTLHNSFYEKTLVLNSKHWITLSNKSMDGNIRIISSKGVTIKSSFKANDIIIYAPRIEVEKGFTGNLQLFANDTIMINDGVSLLFPSVAAILSSPNSKAFISIGKGSEILGDVLLSVSGNYRNSRAECIVNEDAIITGRIYCGGKLGLKGSVHGTIYTNGFVLRTKGSIYENHLLNATINFSALPAFYCGSLMSEKVERYKIVKCLL